MEQVIRAEVPIRIKNVENPMGSGTIIFPDKVQHDNGFATPPPTPAVLAQNGYHLDLSRKHPTAVTVKDKICVLNIHSNRKSVSHGFLAKIFMALDEHNIIVDLISTSEVHVSMALSPDVTQSSLEKAILDLKKLGAVRENEEHVYPFQGIKIAITNRLMSLRIWLLFLWLVNK
jgi:aspartate kinase